MAEERRVPAFVIFSDRSLIDMAERSPRNLTEFAEVHGVGAVKLEKEFGKVFFERDCGGGRKSTSEPRFLRKESDVLGAWRVNIWV